MNTIDLVVQQQAGHEGGAFRTFGSQEVGKEQKNQWKKRHAVSKACKQMGYVQA
jgi:hypothetical protein